MHFPLARAEAKAKERFKDYCWRFFREGFWDAMKSRREESSPRLARPLNNWKWHSNCDTTLFASSASVKVFLCLSNEKGNFCSAPHPLFRFFCEVSLRNPFSSLLSRKLKKIRFLFLFGININRRDGFKWEPREGEGGRVGDEWNGFSEPILSSQSESFLRS